VKRVKRSFIFSFLIVSAISFYAQNKKGNTVELDKGPHAFKKKDLDVNLGLGLGIGYGWGRHYTRFTPPLIISADYAVHDNVSIGAFFAYTRARSRYVGIDSHNGVNYNYSYTYLHTFYVVGLRGAYHFGDLIGEENLDVYAGAMLGNAFHSTSFTYDDPYKKRSAYAYYHNGGGFIFGVYGGGRYYFKKNLAVYGEFGWGLSYGNIGLTIKIR